MRYYKGIRRWVRRFFAPLYPQIVSVSEITDKPIKFRIHSDTEHFRTLDYGAEREQLETLISLLEPDDIFYDVGANIGFTSIVVACQCPQGQIIAFEPDPDIMERLQQNVALNQFNHITAYPYALSDKIGEVELFTDGNDSVSPSLTGQNVNGITLNHIKVSAQTIDALIESGKTPLPTVLKVDVEGAEYAVFQGAEKLLSGGFGNRPRIIFLEAHPEFLIDYGVSVEELLVLLQGYGYEIEFQYIRNNQSHYFLRVIN